MPGQGSISLTSDDSFVLDGRVFSDFAFGDCVLVDFPNDLSHSKASKNGGGVIAKDEKGNQADVTLRLLLGSADDAWLVSRLQQIDNDFAAQTLMTTSFSKRVGDGTGPSGIKSKVYAGVGGTIKKRPGAKMSSDGDEEQSVAVWVLHFLNVGEVIQ